MGGEPLPCARCPCNGGNPFQPTRADAGSGGLLAGEIRWWSFRRAYTSRSLSVHPDMPTIPLIAFTMIAFYHISFGALCQFLPYDFLSFCESLFFLPMWFFAPCLPNVYQKGAESLGAEGPRKSPFFVCLPNVYQRHFFRGKGAVFCVLGQFLKEKSVCKGRYTRLNGLESPQNLEKQGKRSEKTFKK